MPDSLHSDILTSLKGQDLLGPYKIYYFFQPLEGKKGGDRFSFDLRDGGDLFFYLADATGHGKEGEIFWEKHSSKFDGQWSTLISSQGTEEDFYQFINQVNQDLTSSGTSASQLCLVSGRLSAKGDLFFVNCGYGTHLLLPDLDTAPPMAERFGLKLGWIGRDRWSQLPSSWRPYQLTDVERLVLTSDGYLADDYQNIHKTLENLTDLEEITGRLEESQIIDYILENYPQGIDDLALGVIKLEG